MRPYLSDDAAALAELAGARVVADTALAIVHPLSVAVARSNIAAYAASFQADRGIHFAIEPGHDPGLIGGIELVDLDPDDRQAELTFWIAASASGRGYATEAARAVIEFAFERLDLNRVHARHLTRDEASGAVLRKAGMKLEGLLREGVRKWDVFEDVAVYATLRSEHGSG